MYDLWFSPNSIHTPLLEGQRCVDPELKKGQDPQLPGLS